MRFQIKSINGYVDIQKNFIILLGINLNGGNLRAPDSDGSLDNTWIDYQII